MKSEEELNDIYDFNDQIIRSLGLVNKRVTDLSIELRQEDWPLVKVTRYKESPTVIDNECVEPEDMALIYETYTLKEWPRII